MMSVDSLREYLMMVICHTENEIQKDNQIKKDYDDEIEFSDGVEAEEHNGPKNYSTFDEEISEEVW